MAEFTEANKIQLDDLLECENYNGEEIKFLLELTNPSETNKLYKKAYRVKERYIGRKTYFRGLIELSNVCEKDCLYCGIRASGEVGRFTIPKDEVLALAKWAHENRYGSITIQAGERTDAFFVDYITDLIKSIKSLSDGELGITLSLGEQSPDVYKQWREAGAHRYLLRIETSNKGLFNIIHETTDNMFEKRIKNIESLIKTGFQTGTGVMIGLPNQTTEDLANDILFFKKMDIGMIGMGPYVIAEGTPLGDMALAMGLDTEAEKKRRLTLALNMIAVTRLVLGNVNIASATALHALDPKGREKALRAGANILMPVLTLPQYKRRYTLYDGKPGLDDDAMAIKNKLVHIVESAGDTVGFGELGDAPKYKSGTL